MKVNRRRFAKTAAPPASVLVAVGGSSLSSAQDSPLVTIHYRDGKVSIWRISMRFVKGKTLRAATQEFHEKRTTGQIDSLEFLSLLNAFVTVCNTIAYAHSRGILHRDIKGMNVILGDFGEVVVLDWGLAKHVGRSENSRQEVSVALDPSRAQRTLQGQMLGTPEYMAPEQAAGQLDRMDQRTDVYGLGATLGCRKSA